MTLHSNELMSKALSNRLVDQFENMKKLCVCEEENWRSKSPYKWVFEVSLE